MSSLPTRIWRYIFGPTVYRCHNPRSNESTNRGYNYTPNEIEKTSEKVVGIFKFTKAFITYTIPIWAILIYRKGGFTVSYALGIAKLTGWIYLFYFSVILARGFGRSRNSKYVRFLSVLNENISDPHNQDKKKQLRQFDFDFSQWPVDFRWNEADEKRTRRRIPSVWSRIASYYSNPLTAFFLGIPMEAGAYLISHSFGLSMVYPGSTRVFRAAMGSVLDVGRTKLVEQHRGHRAKLEAEDGNYIDTMFVDRRPRSHPGKLDKDNDPDVESEMGCTLVICCEGNAGFYEVGCMVTPLECGYSTLGWNHPGFMGSSGAPFPDAEKNAIDVTMQYAIHKLGFEPRDIIIFAWSIGAFSAINAAASYPDVKGLFLDSTFNDILVFGHKLMPPFLESLVTYTIRNHLNLNNAENLRRYKGPVAFVRRGEDEVMNIDGPGLTRSNLGNLLLEDFLISRFPNLFESGADDSSPQAKLLRNWLHAPGHIERASILTEESVSAQECRALLLEEISESGSVYPSLIGERLSSAQKSQLVLYLASKYMRHYSSSHCPPLPASKFTGPWDPAVLVEEGQRSDADFEFVTQP